MKTPPGVSDPLDQLPLDEAVYVLVRSGDKGEIAATLVEDRLET